MVIKSNIVEAVNSLLAAKQRSILALIGIVVGIGSVIAMVSVGAIVQAEALRQFMEMGTDVVSMSDSHGGGPKQTKKALTMDIALGIAQACPTIGIVAPYATQYDMMKFLGIKKSIPIMGVTQEFLAVNKLSLVQGRFLHPLDRHMFYCVVGDEVASKLRKQGVTQILGTRILINEKYFTIIGEVANVPMGGLRPYEINGGVMIPFSTLKRISKETVVRNIIARSQDGASQARIESQVNTYLASQGMASLRIMTAEQLIAQMQKQMRLFTLLLGTIGSISLVVGGIGVMNVMLVSVTERTKEIGIRRALGAREGDIMLQFLIESVFLCIVGGLIGIGMGVGASWIIAYYAKWQFSVFYPSIVLGVAVAVTVGVFFGIYPARQAARLSPILALRSE